MSKEQLLIKVMEAYQQGATIYLTKEGMEYLKYDNQKHTARV